MKILVTGAKGFIGKAIASHLLKNLHGIELCLHSRDNSIHGPFDVIVHCGAAANPHCSVYKIFNDNFLFTKDLVDKARIWNSKFIFMSSMSVYGIIQSDFVNQNTPINKPNFYGSSKLFGESLLEEYYREIPSISLRLPGVIGPGAHPYNWLPSIALALKAEQDVVIYNSECPFNNAVHISDLCKFVLNLINNSELAGAQIATLAANGTLSVESIVRRLAAGLGIRNCTLQYSNIKPTSFIISSQYAQRTFGYAPMSIGPMIDRFAEEMK